MNLSDRLMKIIKFVKEDTIILDVGTDHGYVPIYIVEKNICKKAIASDVSRNSLKKTIELIKKKGLEENISSRLGDGLDVIRPYEVDGVIMAGMGGILIQNILKKDKKITDSINYFIFQPMVASKELRKYLSQNNYKIVDEELSKEDNKFYEIIYAKRGKEDVKKEIYYEISEKLIEKNHPLLKEFVEDKIKSVKSVIDVLKEKKSKRSIERYNELNKLLDE
ncbi:MAG: tRNA (adenine(22)-N(1))-methyltransferase [Tissierella sp.]|uniref:tRNA (adenine(22)-N(1))-methyltransferase n=1 Tax=Tissierella sp. TaxID=41274 RepID=UPI003F998C23